MKGRPWLSSRTTSSSGSGRSRARRPERRTELRSGSAHMVQRPSAVQAEAARVNEPAGGAAACGCEGVARSAGPAPLRVALATVRVQARASCQLAARTLPVWRALALSSVEVASARSREGKRAQHPREARRRGVVPEVRWPAALAGFALVALEAEASAGPAAAEARSLRRAVVRPVRQPGRHARANLPRSHPREDVGLRGGERAAGVDAKSARVARLTAAAHEPGVVRLEDCGRQQRALVHLAVRGREREARGGGGPADTGGSHAADQASAAREPPPSAPSAVDSPGFLALPWLAGPVRLPWPTGAAAAPEAEAFAGTSAACKDAGGRTIGGDARQLAVGLAWVRSGTPPAVWRARPRVPALPTARCCKRRLSCVQFVLGWVAGIWDWAWDCGLRVRRGLTHWRWNCWIGS